MKAILSCLISSSFLLSCAHAAGDEKEMHTLASHLLLVSGSVENTVRYVEPANELTDKELIVYATKHDPALIKPFENYTVKAKGVLIGQKKHSHILVCTLEEDRALLEDVGCTSELDKSRFRDRSACEVTLDVAAICEE